MAKYVREIINPQLFFLGPRASLALARGCILALGISAVPIVDDDGRPIGVISLRDLAGGESGRLDAHMSQPVKTVLASAKIDDAGRLLADSGVHRLVAVDDDGRAVGMLSALDVIRGLLGVAAHFPERFHHRDPATGLEWRGDYDLTHDNADQAPTGPGLIILKYGLSGVPEVPVWVGLADNIQQTLRDMIEEPAKVDTLVAEWGSKVRSHCRFRTAVVEDDVKRNEALSAVRAGTRVRAWARQIQVTR